MTLLDSCILIDVLRGREAAAEFVSSLPARPSLSVITATELIAGVRNASERRRIDQLLETYVVHGIDLEIAALAGDYVHQYGRSHFVDPIDALIAATAKVLGAKLATLAGLKPPYRA